MYFEIFIGMSFFQQAKVAKDMMKGMNPGQIRDLMKMAKENQGMIEEQIIKAVRKELNKMELPTRQEFEALKQELERLRG